VSANGIFSWPAQVLHGGWLASWSTHTGRPALKKAALEGAREIGEVLVPGLDDGRDFLRAQLSAQHP
jgi:hypothetical protein